MASATDGTRLALTAGIASVGVALLLVGLKGWAFWSTGALTIAASLTDSAMDLVVSAGALFTIAYAARPPDAEHRFGHSAAEDLFALAQAVAVAASALAIAIGAVGRIGAAPGLEGEAAGIAVMAASLALTGALVLWQRHVVRRTGSRVVAADQLHYLGDMLPALGAIAALGASARWGVTWPDTALTLVAAAVLLAGAIRLGRAALDALMDREADPATVAAIRAIAADEPGLRGFHDLRTRRSGTRLFVQIHVEIDGSVRLDAAHAIGARLRRRIVAAFLGADVIVHKDPA